MIKFDNKPKDPHRGWLLGTNLRTSDFLLCRTKEGIGRNHLYITANERLYAEAQDNSTCGTAVGYDGKAKGEGTEE